jgi:hypothetical protein
MHAGGSTCVTAHAGDHVAEVAWNAPAPHAPTIIGLTENRTVYLLFRARGSIQSALDARA